ncbi:mucin-13 [Lathamus discolor]|uniref:mucin-13 n=1 Tax=Lathamus discolor TaxID=678569 RepID=UPI0032B80EF8
MRCCVVLVVLLSLVFFSKGNDTAPETTPSTTQESEGNDTAPETTPSTTQESEGNDTAPETTPSTTQESEGNDTAPETTPSTTQESEGNDIAPETTPSTTQESEGMTPASSSATTPATMDFCNPDPCGKKMARCVALNSNYTCQCQYGFYYSSGNCHSGIIFPGVVTLTGSYSSSVQIVNSLEYEEVFKNITLWFKDAFKDLDGFAETVIMEIQLIQIESRASSQVSLTVTNLFKDNSNVTNVTVTDAIYAEMDESSYVSAYTVTTYCAAFKCDMQTTRCEDAMYPECLCKDGFAKTDWDERSCSDCSESCSSEQNKYCERVGAVPTCKCMANFEKKDDSCVPCSVGYSGEDCMDNTELILIIVGTVLGAIILSLLIAVSIVSARNKHRQDPEQKRLIKSGHSNSNTYADGQTRMFPRVQTTSGHMNPGYQPNNPYEMSSTNRDQYDDLYEISREREGFRMQSKY